MTTHKMFARVTVKDADQGTVEAVFSTFGVVDKDGDVTRKGAIENGAEVVISAYGHKSWDGLLPVGKGTIRVDASEAVLEGQFFLGTTAGRDTFETVKELGDLQEWSYSLEEVKAERGTLDGKAVNFLNKITVKEVSPVLRGSGVRTRTLAVKGTKQLTSMIARMLDEAGSARWSAEYGWSYLDDFDLDDGTAVFCVVDYSTGERVRQRLMVDFTRTDTSVELGDDETPVEFTTVYIPKSGERFSEHVMTVMAGVDGLLDRATEVVALRAEKGKAIAPATAEQLTRLDGSLERLKALLVEPTPAPTDDEMQALFLRSVANIQGVTIS